MDHNWVKFEGQFQNGKKNGSGNLVLNNADTIKGTFKDGHITAVELVNGKR